MNPISTRILCVDDELNVLTALKRQLRKEFDITTASSGAEGLQRIQADEPFAVVVSDHKMPEMSGDDFLQQVHRLSPDTVTVMLTGRPDLDVAVAALHKGNIFRFLQKPCPQELLEKTLRNALEQYRLAMAERILTAELNARNEELGALNQELERRVNERTATIRRLFQFVTDLNGLDTLQDVADAVVATTADVLRSRRVSLMLPQHGREYLSIVAAVGISDDLRSRIRVPIGGSIAGRVFADSQSIVANAPSDLNDLNDRYDSAFFASVPLVSSLLVTLGGPVGVLNVTEPLDDQPYTAEDLAQLRAISETAAIAVQNQIRLVERNEARDATILALAKLAENRDPETGAHLERVQGYCRLLSETMAAMPKYAGTINKSFIDTIVRSSPLHDIGKVGIRDNVLLKPGRLTPEEFEIMKRHSTIGGNTIRALIEQGRTQDFLQMGMEIAYHHHEKYSGKGYPDGLAGEAIPLSARIVAVADVYDALTSKRVYKEAMPHDEAAAIIRKENGFHFDPDVVEAFVHQEIHFHQLAEALAEDTSDPTEPTPSTIHEAPGCAGSASNPATACQPQSVSQ